MNTADDTRFLNTASSKSCSIVRLSCSGTKNKGKVVPGKGKVKGKDIPVTGRGDP
jgi:hypothetical protein